MKHTIEQGLSARSLFFIGTVTLFFTFIWTGTSDIESNVVTLRYFLFVLIGLQAFLTPYLFFPDNRMATIQLGNISGKKLNRYLLRKFFRYSMPIYIMLPAMIVGDLHDPFGNIDYKISQSLWAITIYTGSGFIALFRYLKSGLESQFWQESEKGKELRKKVADYMKYPLDPGAIPSLVNTMLVLLVGAGGIIISVYVANQFHHWIGFLVGVIIFLYGFYLMKRTLFSIDRYFYSTNAFFREFFGETLSAEEAGVKREVEQLWWVPASIRVHVWQFIVQTERIIPAGRLLGAAHAVILFIAYQKPDEKFMLYLWIMFAVLHHLLILLTFKEDISPVWLHRWLSERKIWIASRFWMQVRWLLPLLVGMNIQLFLFGVPGFLSQAVVISIYLISGVLIAIIGNNRLLEKVNT